MQNILLTAVEDPTVRHGLMLDEGRIEIVGISVNQSSPFIGKLARVLWPDKH